MIHHSPENHARLGESLRARLGGKLLGEALENGIPRYDIRAEHALETVRFLKSEPDLGFTFFVDLTAADYSEYSIVQPGRYAVSYQLLSPKLGIQVRLRAFVDAEEPVAPSISSLFMAANWAEREVFDLFGIRFDGHPDLRRILMPEDFEDHPLRKDYPLRGRGERSSYEVYQGTRED